MRPADDAGRAGCAVAILILAAPVAHAGAWTQPDGETLEISSVSRERGGFGETWRTDLYLEHGLSPRWSGHLKVEGQIRIEDDVDDRTAVEFGVRRRLWSADNAAVSVQMTALLAEELDGEECAGAGGEARLAAGYSRGLGAGSLFLNAETAWRRRSAGCDRALAEITAGYAPVKRVSLQLKAWVEDGPFEATGKAEALAFWSFDDLSVGAGYRRSVLGPLDEEGVVVTLWRRY